MDYSVLTPLLTEGFEILDESIIICPCGDYIEWDGQCPEGHVSPIRTLGLI